MLSIPDMALLGAAALLLFGPEQLPRVLRKVGQFTREVQNTSQSFIREIERAADVQEAAHTPPHDDLMTPTYDPLPHDFGDVGYGAPQPQPHPHVEEPDVAAPDPERPVGEKLAEPRSAIDLETPPPVAAHPMDAPTIPMAAITIAPPAAPPPE